MVQRTTLLLPFIILITYASGLVSQAGIQLNTTEALESYTLIEASQGNYLLNNCGEIVNRWPDARRTELHTKLLPNGNLIYIKGGVFEMNWDGDLVRRTDHNEFDLILTYEVIVLPNGNFLCLARRVRNFAYFESIGYNFDKGFPEYEDTVVELVPGTGEIVWEWNLMDHVIQERNSSLPNYGVVSENPQLLNLDAISTYDWEYAETFMINGFDYNPDLDQIILSVRKMSEVCIIDHSTTTAEAKGSTGGRYGKGGDILFRFGNPINYKRGIRGDRRLWYQHNPSWILYGEHKGKISIFNNGLDRSSSFNNRYSSIEVISPMMDDDGNYVIADDSAFMLDEDQISHNKTTGGPDFYSGYTSGVKVMPNGNFYVTVGAEDRFFEFNSDGEIVWEYTANTNYPYRSEKYPLDYAAFADKDLTPSGTLENPTSTYDCSLFDVAVDDQFGPEPLHIRKYGQAYHVENPSGDAFGIMVTDLQGRVIYSNRNEKSFHTFDTSNLQSGIYLLRVVDGKTRPAIKLFIE